MVEIKTDNNLLLIIYCENVVHVPLYFIIIFVIIRIFFFFSNQKGGHHIMFNSCIALLQFSVIKQLTHF